MLSERNQKRVYMLRLHLPEIQEQENKSMVIEVSIEKLLL